MTTFKPTHLLTNEFGTTKEVMLVNGALLDEYEVAHHLPADYALDGGRIYVVTDSARYERPTCRVQELS